MNTNGSIVASGFRSYVLSPECVGATPATNRTVSGSCASITVSNSRRTTVRCAMRGRQATWLNLMNLKREGCVPDRAEEAA
jgi:hypothetical protein